MACGIYKFENKINHMIYIGLALDLKERYNKHYKNIKDKSHQEDFYIALRQYGWDNFDYEILESFDSYDSKQLSFLEDFYIKKYNSLKPNGYNMVPGGYNGSGLAKGKPIEQYDLDGNYIAEYPSAHEASRSTGINFSSICACARGETKQIKGYQWKYKDSNKEIFCLEKKYVIQKVYQFSLDGKYLAEYNNLQEAYSLTGITKSLICLSCLYPTRTAGGYHWSYNKDYIVPNYKLQGQSNKKPVKQFDKYNNFIAEYPSILDAEKQTGVNKGNISSVCCGHRKSAGGYIWQYS